MRSHIIRVLLLASVVAACGGKDEDLTGVEGRGTVTGAVRDAETDVPLAGVAVTVGDVSTESDAEGHFEVAGVPAGDRAIAAAKTGYVTYQSTVTVDVGKVTEVAIELSAPTERPATPALVFASSSPGLIEVFWVAAPRATSYRVYWSTSPGVTPETGTLLSEVTTTEGRHTDLTPGTVYYYVVTGVNDAGEGPPSGEVTASSSDGIALGNPQLTSALAPGPVRVLVRISSTFQLVSVVAHSGDRSAPLSFDPLETARNAWVGDLSLETAGVPTLISVTATDITGASSTSSVNLVPEPRITLTVNEPDNAAVSQGTVRFQASCQNCTTISVTAEERVTGVGRMTVASGPSPLDQTVSLAAFDGKDVSLRFAASAANQSVGIDLHLYVESSSRLELSSSFGGDAQILDVSPDRILAFDSTSGTFTLRARDRRTGTDQVLFSQPDARPTIGFLSPAGALFVDTRFPSTLYENRGGTVTRLGDINSFESLRVAGGFAIWNSNTTLFRRDLASGTNTIVAGDAGNNSNDVAANGDVVYWISQNYDIVRVRDGVSTSITEDGSTIWDVYPVTDGDIIAWPQVQQGGNPGGTAAFVDGSTLQLASGPGQRPLVSNGWIAFTQPAPGGIGQVFVRSPAGDERQVSLFSGGAHLEALSSDGAVIFSTGVELRRRYLVPPGGDAIEISSWLGRGLFVGSDAYVAIAGTLFRVR
jgi:Carboxypeptidase regulatory-like domain